MAGTKIAKKLPKRADSKHRSHIRNAECWLRGEDRKAARRKAQAERERINKERGYTAWQNAKRERAAARA